MSIDLTVILRKLEETIDDNIASNKEEFIDRLMKENLFLTMTFDYFRPKDVDEFKAQSNDSEETLQGYREHPFTFISFTQLIYDMMEDKFNKVATEEYFFLENFIIDNIEKACSNDGIEQKRLILGVLGYLEYCQSKIAEHFNIEPIKERDE